MKHPLSSRAEKIAYLKNLSSGKESLDALHAGRCEFWVQDDSIVGKFRNEVTGELINAEAMEEKERTKGNSILWIEIRST